MQAKRIGSPTHDLALGWEGFRENSAENEKISNSINKRIVHGLALEEAIMFFSAATSLQFYIGTFLATIIYRGFVPENFLGTVLLE
jgi:hypothetical protein